MKRIIHKLFTRTDNNIEMRYTHIKTMTREKLMSSPGKQSNKQPPLPAPPAPHPPCLPPPLPTARLK